MTPPRCSPEVVGQDAKTPTETPFLDNRDLALLRHGPDRNAAYARLHERCREHVLGDAANQSLTPVECEAIVAQAVVNELPHLLDPKLDAAAVSLCLSTALSRVRTRLLRKRHHLQGTLSSLVEDEQSLSTPLQVARAMDGFVGQALDSLGAEDRNLLIKEYRLERFGFDEHGSVPPTVGLAGLSAYRARKRFRRALDRLISEAIAEHDREASLLVRLRNVIRNPTFLHALMGSSPGSL